MRKIRFKKDRLSEQQLFDVYLKEGTLQKTADATGYSMQYLKKLSGQNDWVNRSKLQGIADESDAFVEIIKGVDGSIQRISKIPIVGKIPKSKNKGIEGLVLGDEEILLDKIETDSEGNVVISEAETRFMRQKIQEREQSVEQERKQKEEKKTRKVKKEPFEAAVDDVIRTIPSAANNRKHIERELRRWLGKWYSLPESIGKVISTMQQAEEERQKESSQPKPVEDRGGMSEALWNKMWGKITLS